MIAQQLVNTFKELPTDAFNDVFRQLVTIGQKRGIQYDAENLLLLQIFQDIPNTVYQRFDELIEKRQLGTLTPFEHEELLALTEQIEEQGVRRIEALSILAQMRKTTVRSLMKTLNVTFHQVPQNV